MTSSMSDPLPDLVNILENYLTRSCEHSGKLSSSFSFSSSLAFSSFSFSSSDSGVVSRDVESEGDSEK